MIFNDKLNYSIVKGSRIIIILALVSMLTFSAYSSTTLSVVKALDLSSLGGNEGLSGLDMGNLCFASDCTNQNIKDNQNSPVVTDSDNTNIESGEGDLNHRTNPGLGSDDGTGTLSVQISIQCEGEDIPSEDLYPCETASTLPQYPTPQSFSITISGNNPNPSKFNGESDVELGAGEYTITATFDSTALNNALNAAFPPNLIAVSTSSMMNGDCNISNSNANSINTTGTMSAGDNQVCFITYMITLTSAGPG